MTRKFEPDPEVLVDVLVDALRVSALRGAIFNQLILESPWALRFRPDSWVGFHWLIRGSAWIEFDDAPAHTRVEAGELVLIGRAEGHMLTTQPGMPARTVGEVLGEACVAGARTYVADADIFQGDRKRVHASGDCVLICGCYHFDANQDNPPVLSMLPRVLHLANRDIAGDEQLGNLLTVIRREFANPGTGSKWVLDRMVDTMLLYILRHWLVRADAPPSSPQLAATHDVQLGRALAMLHREPLRAWSVDELANQAGMSRAVFARRFRDVLGVPPIRYLTSLRLALAAHLLRSSDQSIAEIAHEVGYGSPFSFIRAFTREHNMSPARYRAADRN